MRLFADVLQNKFLKLHSKALKSESLFNKVADLKAWRPATLLKRDSNTGVFLWSLRHFYNTFFYKTLPVAASAF